MDRNGPTSRTALCGCAARLSTAAAAGAYQPFFDPNPNKKNQRLEVLTSDTLAQTWYWQTISLATRNRILEQASRKNLGSSNPPSKLTSTSRQYLLPHMVTLRLILIHCMVRCAGMMMSRLLTILTEDRPPGLLKRISAIIWLLRLRTRLLYPD